MTTFALAEGAFYHFGLLSTPTHARALMNWALVLEHVRRDADQAGKRSTLYATVYTASPGTLYRKNVACNHFQEDGARAGAGAQTL